MGHKGAVTLLAASFAVAYIWVVGLVITGAASPWLFVVFLSVPKLGSGSEGFRPERNADEYDCRNEINSPNKYIFRIPALDRIIDQLFPIIKKTARFVRSFLLQSTAFCKKFIEPCSRQGRLVHGQRIKFR